MYDRILSGIMGLCIGDAVGVPVEFKNRKLLKNDPVTDMRSYGTHSQPKGTWSDDTTMTLCLADSIGDIGTIDLKDIMDRFVLWVEKGEYTAYDEVFDIGVATRNAIFRYLDGSSPINCGGKNEYDNGNGSLMRILPLAFYIYKKYGNDFFKNEWAVKEIHNVSSLTHNHPRSKISCGIYISVAVSLISNKSIDNIQNAINNAFEWYENNGHFSSELVHFKRLRDLESFKNLSEDNISSSGYTVHTLEASLWCLMNSNSYEEAVLKAVNLGDDTDTTGAVTGGLAGILYGYDTFPKDWVESIPKSQWIKNICVKFNNSIMYV